MAKRVRVCVWVDVTLTERELWPDGGAPSDWYADVFERAKSDCGGRLQDLIDLWDLYPVHCSIDALGDE